MVDIGVIREIRIEARKREVIIKSAGEKRGVLEVGRFFETPIARP